MLTNINVWENNYYFHVHYLLEGKVTMDLFWIFFFKCKQVEVFCWNGGIIKNNLHRCFICHLPLEQILVRHHILAHLSRWFLRLAYSIVLVCRPSFTVWIKNISNISRPISTKLHVNYCWGKELPSYGYPWQQKGPVDL